MSKPRTYFIPFSHVSPQGPGFGSMTVVTPDGLMTPTRLNETIALVKSEHPGWNVVVLGFFPLDREPADESEAA